MSESVLGILIKAKDLASGPINIFTKTLKNAKDEVEKMGGVMNNFKNSTLSLFNNGINATSQLLKTGLIIGITGAVATFGILGKTALDQAGAFEQYRATLKVMLGTQELANARLKEYAEIGAKTPFELKDVVNLGNQLQALGRYSKENVLLLGDLASASSKPIEQVSGAFAKLASGQKGIAVDMFRDLLITTEDWTKATGKGITKSGELMATTEEMIAVLPKIMKDKKFIGMMEEQSKTFIGKMSNLTDAFSLKMVAIGDMILPYLKPIIDQLISYINSIDINKILSDVQLAFNTYIVPIINFINANGPIIQAVLLGLAVVIGGVVVSALISMGVAMVTATWPFLALGAVAGGLFYAFQNNFLGIQSIVNFLGQFLVWWYNNLVSPVFSQFSRLFNFLIPHVQSFASFMLNIFNGIGSYLGGFFKGLINSWISNLNNGIGAINSILRALPEIPNIGKINQLPYIPQFARGGVMPNSGLAIVGERGPELVNLPLGARVHSNEKSNQILAGNQANITVNIDAKGAFLDEKSVGEFVDKFKRVFEKRLKTA